MEWVEAVSAPTQRCQEGRWSVAANATGGLSSQRGRDIERTIKIERTTGEAPIILPMDNSLLSPVPQAEDLQNWGDKSVLSLHTHALCLTHSPSARFTPSSR